jgi:hypothetical protein
MYQPIGPKVHEKMVALFISRLSIHTSFHLHSTEDTNVSDILLVPLRFLSFVERSSEKKLCCQRRSIILKVVVVFANEKRRTSL